VNTIATRRPAYVIHVYRDAGGQWRWRMRAPNGRLVADSGEGYTRRVGAFRAARQLASALITVAPLAT
jgi:uncharacterized protein YegP (UPF0339 family)